MVFSLVLALPVWSMSVGTAHGPAPPHPDKKSYYRLWHNDNGWHLRWSSNAGQHSFSGRVWSPDGNVNLGRRVKLEPNDRVYKQGRGINFQAKAGRGGEDGFDFRWQGPNLWLELETNGKPFLNRIMVGPAGIHPNRMPFVINWHKNRRPPPRGEWVPGHFDRRKHWIPGHWRRR